MKKNKRDNLLELGQVIFYLGFLLLWFKDNFAPLRRISLSPLIMFVLFAFIFIWRSVLKIKRSNFNLPRPARKTLLAIVIIIGATFLLRLPYLANYLGLLTSDEALFLLEAKHISEGKVPPICAYGQLYQGTVGSHFFAVIFKIFGYSIFAFKFFTLFLYACFIIIQFLFLKEIFPFTFSLLVSLFYSLPLGHLVHISLDDSFIFPLILLLGFFIVYLGYLVAYRNQEKYLSWLGFLIGLSFWAHQMTIYFILVGVFLVVCRYRFIWKKYLIIFLYALVGFFPQLMIEIFYKFHLIKFLTGGETNLSWEKVRRTLWLISSLLTLSESPTRFIFIFIIFIGLIGLFWYALRTKQLLPLKIYGVYFIIFLVIYFLSGHSSRYLIRYLYPLFFCLPIVFFSGFLLIRSKLRYVAMGGLIIALIFYDARWQHSYFVAIKNYQAQLKEVVNFINASKIKYWRADFWTSYLLTAITGEKTIIASTSFRRYYPYELDYFNCNDRENFIFLRGEGTEERNQAINLLSLLNGLKINYEMKVINDAWFIYNIDNQIVYFEPEPPHVPELEKPDIEIDQGFLILTFRNKKPQEGEQFFWLHVEIPSFSTRARIIFLNDKEIKIRLPFPPWDSAKIIYYLSYWGTKMPQSYGEILVKLPGGESTATRRPESVYLYGFGPVVDYNERKMRVCQKEARLEWNRKLNSGESLCLVLHSPFQFSHLHWYGRFSQEVEILVNDRPLSVFRLKEDRSLIKIGSDEALWKERNNIITLKFKYHYNFDFAPSWKTAALLERVYVEQKSKLFYSSSALERNGN